VLTRKPGDLPSNVAQPEDGVFHWCGLPFEATTDPVASLGMSSSSIIAR